VIHPPWQSPNSPRLRANTTEAYVTLIGGQDADLRHNAPSGQQTPRNGPALGPRSNLCTADHS
jgi:hypothetical protein